MSATGLPRNGEAQLAEVRLADGSSAIIFNGRSKSTGSPRGIAWSFDGGVTFTDIRFAHDLSAGVSCLASMISLLDGTQPAALAAAAATSIAGSMSPQRVPRRRRRRQATEAAHTAMTSTTLLFAHPSQPNRSAGVLLRSDDGAVRPAPGPCCGCGCLVLQWPPELQMS
eukprot:COSAG01_NODE_22905_length_836_cov_1.371777_1_plen_169_part_00